MNEPRFVVDMNVGRLATWLRVMGYDALFPRDEGDDELVRIALRDGRIIVTRDRAFAQRRLVTTGRLRIILIDRDDLAGQLRQVVGSLHLDTDRGLSRCLRCNEPLLESPREAVGERVPPYVYETQRQFFECPLCLRIYWRGTHWTNMRGELARLQNGGT